MLDGGSQRSYITNDLKTRLRLKPVRVETMHLNTFGTDLYEKKQRDLVEVVLKGHHGESVHLRLAKFLKVCSPLSTKVDVCTLTELHGFDWLIMILAVMEDKLIFSLLSTTTES